MPTYSFIVPKNVIDNKFVYIPNGNKDNAFLVNISNMNSGDLIEFDDPETTASPEEVEEKIAEEEKEPTAAEEPATAAEEPAEPAKISEIVKTMDDVSPEVQSLAIASV